MTENINSVNEYNDGINDQDSTYSSEVNTHSLKQTAEDDLENTLPRNSNNSNYSDQCSHHHLSFLQNQLQNIFKSTYNSKKIPITIDLLRGCKRLIKILTMAENSLNRLLSNVCEDDQRLVYKIILYRYEILWLPLAGRYKLYTGAPIDVYLMWFAHMLNTTVYRQECQSICGEQIEHFLVCQNTLKNLTNKASELWKSRYPAEPFNLDVNHLDKYKSQIIDWYSKLSINPIQLIEYNSNFYYQILMPHYLNKSFLEDACERYRKYLYIRKLYCQINQQHYSTSTISETPSSTSSSTSSGITTTENSHCNRNIINNSFLLLTSSQKSIHKNCDENYLSCSNQIHINYLPYDIELCWRVHLFHPRIYVYDTSRLFGRTLEYFSNQSNKTNNIHWTLNKQNGFDEKSLFVVNSLKFQSSKFSLQIMPRIYELWRLQFPDCEFIKYGCYNRGISTRNRLDILNTEEIYRMSTKCTKVSIQQITITPIPELEKFTLRINTTSSQPEEINPAYSTSHRMCTLKLNSSVNDSNKSITKFTMTTGVCDELLISLVDKRLWSCLNNKQFGQAKFKLTDAIENFHGVEQTQFKFSKELCQDNSEDQYIEANINTIKSNNFPKDAIPSKHSSSVYVTLALLINPPIRHSIRLKVQLGPQLVCQLPLPDENQLSIGYKIWGPVSICPSLHIHNLLKQHYRSCIKQGEILLETFQPMNYEQRSLVLVHKLFNHLNEHVLTVRVQHNILLGLSAVYVYSGNRLLCLGQTIGQEHLPAIQSKKSSCNSNSPHSKKHFKSSNHLLSMRFNVQHSNRNFLRNLNHLTTQFKQTLKDLSQQEDNHNTSSKNNSNNTTSNDSNNNNSNIWGLSQSANDRGILIKDSNGDWCIVIGKWSEFKRLPAPIYAVNSNNNNLTNEHSIDNSNEIHGNGGHLSLKFKWFASASTPARISYAQIPDNTNSFTVILHDASVNMQTGELFISKSCNEIAQNVCLAFCCGILHVLCQPRILTHESKVNSYQNYSECDQSSFPVRDKKINTHEDVLLTNFQASTKQSTKDTNLSTSLLSTNSMTNETSNTCMNGIQMKHSQSVVVIKKTIKKLVWNLRDYDLRKTFKKPKEVNNEWKRQMEELFFTGVDVSDTSDGGVNDNSSYSRRSRSRQGGGDGEGSNRSVGNRGSSGCASVSDVNSDDRHSKGNSSKKGSGGNNLRDGSGMGFRSDSGTGETQDEHFNKNDDRSELMNEVKVYGYAVCQFQSQQYEVYSEPMKSEQKLYDKYDNQNNGYSFQNSTFSTINEKETRNHLNMALTFTMCRACGLPIDSLIPSVQYIRYLIRNSIQFKYVHKSPVDLNNSNNVQSFNDQCMYNDEADASNLKIFNPDIINVYRCKSEKQQSVNNSNSLKLSDDEITSFKRINKQLNGQHGSVEREETSEGNNGGINYRELLNSNNCTKSNDIVNKSNKNDNNSNNSQTCKEYKWRLSDFYDYFILELPDICSGCIPGCRYCNGLDIF
ncbi:unnamed protein product [Trichobilharzia szidati]|nr:unnamed protein product [Trichobilharzia szidati]